MAMLFATHLVIAWLLARVRRLPVAAAVAGSALPDIVDKPFGYVDKAIQVALLAILAVLLRRDGAA